MGNRAAATAVPATRKKTGFATACLCLFAFSLQTLMMAPACAQDRPDPAKLAAAAQTAAVPGARSKALPSTRLFGRLGKPVSLSPVTKRWQKALAKLTEGHRPDGYSALLSQLRRERLGRQIPKVNATVNRLLTYRDDSQLYKTGEYWASPAETLSRRAGDCEDYAILKYAILRDLGVDDKDMRVVVLRDKATRQFHAVLSVRFKKNWLILDNRFSRVRFERDLPHYQPLYAVNAAGEWAYQPPKGTSVRLAARLKSTTE